MTRENPPAYSSSALDGLDAARRAGWARAYGSERAALAIVLELATCMGSNLKTKIQVDNQDHMISVLRWIAADPRRFGTSLNAAGLSETDLRIAAELADRAANAIAERHGIDQAEAQERVDVAFEQFLSGD